MKAFRSSSRAGVALCAAGVALALSAGVNAQVRVAVTNLVTDDQAAHAAQITDGALVNAWGLSYSPTSPFWASSNGMGRGLRGGGWAVRDAGLDRTGKE